MNIRLIVSTTAIAWFCLAQEVPRRSWDDAFRQQRSQANRAAPGQPVAAPYAPAEAYSALGVTIWRLRPSNDSDDRTARLLVQQGSADTSIEWTPVRIEAGMPFSVGDHVRLSIEGLHPGYLYVVDREEYRGGSLGDPLLIFPTTRLRGGDPRILPGRLFDIPAQLDKPPYFTLKRTRSDHVGEVLNLLLISKPLTDVSIGPAPVPLPKQLLERWQAQWGRRTELIEMAGGVGKPWTPAEKAVSGGTRDLLTVSDPLPQTIYRVATKPGDPILIEVPLRIQN